MSLTRLEQEALAAYMAGEPLPVYPDDHRLDRLYEYLRDHERKQGQRTRLRLLGCPACKYEATHRAHARRVGLRLPAEALRAAFVDRLTYESPHHDARRWDYNQPVFDRERGYAVWNGTDLSMVLRAFDDAVNDLAKGRRLG